ncbi:MAG: hypothetical protein IIA19_07395 [Thaumarchaeota archaeon]|nr:hypothetical protein [Nitrososphaerota archaeon]
MQISRVRSRNHSIHSMSKLPNLYKIGIVGLLSILAITIVPFSGETNSIDGKLYGLLTLVQYDENRNEIFSQTVHNRLVNTGETFLLEASFTEGTAPADNTQIGVICIAEGVIDDADEAETSAAFDTANTLTGNNCQADGTVDITTTQGTAIIGPLTFAEPTHLAAADVVNGIGICQTNGVTSPFANCATSGVLFAVIDTADVTINAGETVDITYTFDITSDSN